MESVWPKHLWMHRDEASHGARVLRAPDRVALTIGHGRLTVAREGAQRIVMAHAEARPTLTEAETACLLRGGQGLSYKEIALELDCAPSTVDTHLKSARRKLGSSTTRAAARLYFGPQTLPRSSGPEPFGSDPDPKTEAAVAYQPDAAEPEAVPPPEPVQPTSPALAWDDADDLTPWQKTVRIGAIAIGASLAAGAAIPGTLLLLHALQTLHGAR